MIVLRIVSPILVPLPFPVARRPKRTDVDWSRRAAQVSGHKDRKGRCGGRQQFVRIPDSLQDSQGNKDRN